MHRIASVNVSRVAIITIPNENHHQSVSSVTLSTLSNMMTFYVSRSINNVQSRAKLMLFASPLPISRYTIFCTVFLRRKNSTSVASSTYVGKEIQIEKCELDSRLPSLRTQLGTHGVFFHEVTSTFTLALLYAFRYLGKPEETK